jgi:hypothetical protein
MSALPTVKIVAILGKDDSGEYGNARCPHCGAEGRYVWTFLGDDGRRHGAMAGCLRLFKRADSYVARVTATAIEKVEAAGREGKKAASWWTAIIDATDRLGSGLISISDHAEIVRHQDRLRWDYLERRGFGKYRRRR